MSIGHEAWYPWFTGQENKIKANFWMQAKLPIQVDKGLEVVELGNLDKGFCCVSFSVSLYTLLEFAWTVDSSNNMTRYVSRLCRMNVYQARYLYPVGYKCKRTLPGSAEHWSVWPVLTKWTFHILGATCFSAKSWILQVTNLIFRCTALTQHITILRWFPI